MTSKEMAYQYRLARWTELAKERVELWMSIRAYCAMKGFAESTYFYWQRRLRDAARTHIEAKQTKLPSPGFAQVARLQACFMHSKGVPRSMATKRQAITYCLEDARYWLQVQIHDIHMSVDSSYPPEKLAALLRELCASC